MIILLLQVFVSLVLVAGAVALFVYTIKSRTLEHADRLSLAPLEPDSTEPAADASPGGAPSGDVPFNATPSPEGESGCAKNASSTTTSR